MSDIPDDCIRIARKFSASDDAVMATAAAIWAERQRCAKIADEYECSLKDYGGSVDAEHFYQGGVLDAGSGISQAILNQTEG